MRTQLDQRVAYPCPVPLYALCLLTFWNYFQRAVTNGSTSLVSNMDLVTKVYFPREVLPMSSVLMNLVDWAMSFAMFVVVYAGYSYFFPEIAKTYTHAYPFVPHVRWMWMPVFLFLLTLFTLGVVFFASAMQVYFRDVSHLINLGLLLWLFVTPVLYPLATLKGGRVSTMVILNPMTGLIDGIQLCLIARKFPWEHHVIYSAVFAVGFFLAGYCFFKHEERYFADVV
jgi:lipopolysaccharide transport system permease protein